MKKINTIIFTCLLTFAAGSPTQAHADNDIATQAIQDIDWRPYAVDVNTIRYFKEWNPNEEEKKAYFYGAFYIYDVKRKLFITTGGQYGVQPVQAQSGMLFALDYAKTITNTDGTQKEDLYYLRSNVINPEDATGDCLGVKAKADTATDVTEDGKRILFIDRGEEDEDNHTLWKFGTTSNTRPYTYKFVSPWEDATSTSDEGTAPHYLSHYQSGQKSFYVESENEADADEFYFILVKDYNDLIEKSSYKYIDVSNLIKDARFERMNKLAGETVPYYKPKQAVNADGTPMVDDDGNPVYEKDKDGNIVYEKNPAWDANEWQGSQSWFFSQEKLYTDISGTGNFARLHNYFINDTRYITGNILSYGTAWIGGEYNEAEGSQVFYQNIKNIPAGYYRVECQGFFEADDTEVEPNAYLFGQGALTTEAMDNNEQLADKENYATDIAISDIKTRIKPITEADKATFEATLLLDNDGNPFTTGDDYTERMFKAGKFLAGNNPYVDGTKYNNTVYVKVDPTVSSTTGNLRIGIRKKDRPGNVYVDNFKLYYCGNREWYLNAANTKTTDWNWQNPQEGINKEAWDWPVRYNLRRKFDIKKWNSFIVPFSINADQVKTAFSTGDQVKVSEFKEVTDRDIIFKAVDVEKDGIRANWPYIIWLSKEPYEQDYSFEFDANQKVNIAASDKPHLYHIDGVTPTAITNAAPIINSTNGAVTFHGFYYRPTEGAPADSYVLSGGDLYHLPTTYKGNGIVGTCWYMTINHNGEAKEYRFVNENEDSTATAIDHASIATPTHTAAPIYNICGQHMGTQTDMNHLPAGIYIMNGKKIAVK